jgi:sugar phosphate isomerase/epimerase
MIPSLLTETVTYDLERAVHYALLWGLEGLELGRVGGIRDRVPFINEQKLKARLRASELPVIAVDPGTFVGDVAERSAWLNELVQLDETLRFCARIGCPRIVVSSLRGEGKDAFTGAVEALRAAGRKAERSGIRLCVINEASYLAASGEELALLLEAVNLEAVRAAWDPAAAVQSGEEADAGLAALGGRVELVRCRNGERTGNGWEPRPIDSGEVDWSSQLRALAYDGFDGPLSLDVDVVPAGTEGLRGSTALIRRLRSAVREVRLGDR